MLNRSRINAGRLNSAAAPTEFVNAVALNVAGAWSKPTPTGLVSALSWLIADPLSADFRARWREAEALERDAALVLGTMAIKDHLGIYPYSNKTAEAVRSAAMAWEIPEPATHQLDMRHRDAVPAEVTAELPWGNPPISDVPIAMPIGRLAVLEEIHRNRWPLGEIVHPADWRIPWGFGQPPPTITPNPEIGQPVPPLPGPDPIYEPPPGDQVALPLNCRLTDWPGDQVPLPFRRFDCMRLEFVIDNTIECIRVDTGDPVYCLALNINGDVESFALGISGQMPAESADALIDGPIEIRSTINGIEVLWLAEGISENGDFSGERGRSDSVSVTGRSVSAELDEPYSPAKSRFEEQTRTALQLMQQELPIGGGWSIVAHPAFVDWTIPGGTFSYEGLSPIRAIARIAAAAGAVVQPALGARELIIMPRYPVPPWQQAGESADIEIGYGLVSQYSRQFEPVAQRNGIWVLGETSDGHAVRGTRAGTGGDRWLDNITDPLITDPQAGLARARAELGATGKRDILQLRIPVDTSIGGPAIVETGQLANVVEAVDKFWIGQTIGWSLSASISQNGGLAIWQQVSVERYRGS